MVGKLKGLEGICLGLSLNLTSTVIHKIRKEKPPLPGRDVLCAKLREDKKRPAEKENAPWKHFYNEEFGLY